jgi:hypothetical protein
MLKSIFAGIASALRSIGRFVFGVAMAPFRFVDRILGGDGGDSFPPIPEVKAYDESEPFDRDDRQAMYIEIANWILAWAADSIIDAAPAALPPRLPIALREWLPGLTRAECETLINADEKAVLAHIQQAFPLPGVRPVQRLTPLREWPREPSIGWDEGSPSLVSYAAGSGPAR